MQKIFKRKVNKAEIETCNILGVNIAAINLDWLLEYLKLHIKELSGDYVCVSNVHTTVTSYDDEEYCMIQNNALMAIPDGGPLSTLGHWKGYKYMGRTAGPTVMTEICKVSVARGYRHFFYGADERTLSLMRTQLEKEYEGIQITGMYSPPFRPLTEEEDKLVVKMINDAAPDFIWIGLGAPKQEKWMYEHQGKVNGLMFGVGAAFNYTAGIIKRAPEWMQRSNMEWFYRLLQEPRRLFSRYMKTNLRFLWLIFKESKKRNKNEIDN